MARARRARRRVPPASGRRGAARGAARRDADRRRRGRRGRDAPSARSSSRSSSCATGRRSWRSSRATARRTRARSPALLEARRVTIARAAEDVVEATGFAPGARLAVPTRARAGRPRRADAPPARRRLGRSRLRAAPARHRAGRARAPHARSGRGRRAGISIIPGDDGERRELDMQETAEDLDERRARRLGGRDRSRRCPRPPLRHRRLRGHPGVRDAEGPVGVPPRRPHAAPPREREAPLHGDSVLRRGAPDRRPRARARERPARPATSGRSRSSATARSASTRAGTRSRPWS